MVMSFLSGPFLAVALAAAPVPGDTVVVDYGMAEAAIAWLEEVEAGADAETLRASFRENVVPTAGMEAIVAHWARFREWDAEIFMEFVLQALGVVKPTGPLVDESGETTALGMARREWTKALAELPRLARDLAALKRHDPKRRAVALAHEALPPDAEIAARFYVVLFGVSSAFAVDDMNGYDLLQLPHAEDGSLDIAEITATFAHELHHSGFSAYIEEHMGAAADDPRFTLLGAAAGEGLATCLVSRPDLTSGRWKEALAGADSLMAVFQADVRRGLAGDLPRDELVGRWFTGSPGAVYVVGVHMCETVEDAGGRNALLTLPEDFRRFPALYNASVPDDAPGFRFDGELLARLPPIEANRHE